MAGAEAQVVDLSGEPPLWTTGTGKWAQFYSYIRNKIVWFGNENYVDACDQNLVEDIGYEAGRSMH